MRGNSREVNDRDALFAEMRSDDPKWGLERP